MYWECFEWRIDIFRFDEEFMQNYDEDNHGRYILAVNANYLKELQKEHSDLSFLPKIMKIDKCEKILSNLYHKKHFVVQIRALK